MLHEEARGVGVGAPVGVRVRVRVKVGVGVGVVRVWLKTVESIVMKLGLVKASAG
jgi:hypothetical protein